MKAIPAAMYEYWVRAVQDGKEQGEQLKMFVERAWK